jgi:hypothetical protein
VAIFGFSSTALQLARNSVQNMIFNFIVHSFDKLHNAQSNRAVGVGLPFLVITAMPDTRLGHVNTDADKTDDPCYTLTTNRLLTC